MYAVAAVYLRDRGVDPSRADDVVSNVMTRILSRDRDEAEPENWEAFLTTAAVNGARDIVGAAANRRERLHRFDPCDGDDDTPGDPPTEPRRRRGAHADPVADAVTHALEQQRLIAEVHDAIDALPADQQNVVRRTLLHGETGRQVAADLGLSEGRISQLKSAGITRLVGALDRWAP